MSKFLFAQMEEKTSFRARAFYIGVMRKHHKRKGLLGCQPIALKKVTAKNKKFFSRKKRKKEFDE